jgi:hypothetical protein
MAAMQGSALHVNSSLDMRTDSCFILVKAKTAGFNNLMGTRSSSLVLRFSNLFWLCIRKITFKPLSNFSKQNDLPIQISVMYARLRLYTVRPNLTQHKVSLSQYDKGRIIQGTQNPGDTISHIVQGYNILSPPKVTL